MRLCLGNLLPKLSMNSQITRNLLCVSLLSISLFGCAPKPNISTGPASPGTATPAGAISKEAFKNVTVSVACYKKQNPKASREEAAQALLKIAKEQGIDVADPQKFAMAYMSSMKEYAKDMSYLAEIGKEAQAKGCQ